MPAMDGSGAGGTVFVTVGTTKFDALIRAVDQQVRGCRFHWRGCLSSSCATPQLLMSLLRCAPAASWHSCNASYLYVHLQRARLEMPRHLRPASRPLPTY